MRPPSNEDDVMHKNKKAEREWRRLDRQLDLELEATFPASDAPKITRTGAWKSAASDIDDEHNPELK